MNKMKNLFKKITKCWNTNKTYTEKELVEFGQYLLSSKREKSLKENETSLSYNERKRYVNDADLSNFKQFQAAIIQ